MASIRITQFAGILPEYAARILPATAAQVAHNCLLTDGSLRPQASWVRQETVIAGQEPTMRSIAYDRSADRAIMYTSLDVVHTDGEPFAFRKAVGANLSPPVMVHNTGDSVLARTAAVFNTGVAGTVNYTRAFQSNKPVNRVYGVSRVRKQDGRTEEGSICGIIGDPQALVYEGDEALININFTILDDGANYIRLYRSLTGLDTGEALANEFDTNWHLIAEIPTFGSPIIVYVDGGSIVEDPLDVNYSEQFHPPTLLARFFGLTESGWYVAASEGGEIAVSERYMHHAWPSSQVYKVPGIITDIAVFQDNVFIGTDGFPFVLSLAQGEAGVQGALVPYKEHYRCLPGSMTPTASGAVYASRAGLVALSREGMQVLSRDFANPGNVLYRKVIPKELSPTEETQTITAAIGETNSGTYYNGWYYGFCGSARNDIFFLTSTLYPYLDIENFIHSAALTDAVLREIQKSYVWPPENIIQAASLLSGEMREPLKTYTSPPENMIHSGAILSGVMRQVLLTYGNNPPENMIHSASIVSGQMRAALIQNTAAPENMIHSAALIAASLG